MSGSPESVSQEQIRDRAIRLFMFLREIVSLRTKITRTLDAYEKVLWLCEIPHESECHFVGWGPGTEDESDRTWIEVRKPHLSPAPSVPSELEPWVNPAQLKDSRSEPGIYERILVEVDDESWDEQRPADETEEGSLSRFVELADHPEIQVAWDNYLSRKWRPWAEIDRRKQSVQRLYTDLFTLHQQQKELGETYEVVLGLGQLRWRLSSGQQVNRHLIVAQTALEFDSTRGIVTVGPSMEGAKPTFEQDMLEPTERPPADIQERIEQCVASIEDKIWHNESVSSALMSWANSAADGRGDFTESLFPLDSASDLPRLAFAPALILRRRTERGLLQLYGNILDDLRERSDVPQGLRPLVDIDWQSRGVDGPRNDTGCSDVHSEQPQDEGVYFPLPSNEQQRQILHRLGREQGVLVQGPPGTGKSHTIANLVSHLLAEGKRVLVTSETPRALRVLKEKIPAEVSQLCVVLLGHDQSSFEELEDSVHEITERLNTWDAKHEFQRIRELESRLHILRAEMARAEAALCSIRETETFQHPPMNGDYAGTLQSIAARLEGEESKLGWIAELVPASAELPDTPPLSNAEAKDLLDLLETLTSDRRRELEESFPALTDISAPDDIDRLITAQREAEQAWNACERPEDEGLLARVETGLLQELLDATEIVVTKTIELQNHPLPFARALTVDILVGQEQSWCTLRDQTQLRLAAIAQHPQHIADVHVVGHEQVDLVTLRDDARILLKHLEDGGTLRRWFRYVPQADERRYMIEEIKVGGKKAATADTLRTLSAWADIQFNLVKLKDLWAGVADAPTGDLSQRLAAYRHFCEPLKMAEDLNKSVRLARELLARLGGLPLAPWRTLREVEGVRNLATSELCRRRLSDCSHRLKQEETALCRELPVGKRHTVVTRLAEAIHERNSFAYADGHAELESLWSDRTRLDRRNELLTKARMTMPMLSDALTGAADLQFWRDRLCQLDQSWGWLRTDRWLKQQADPTYLQELVKRKTDLQADIGRTLTMLAAGKAWVRCMERMTPAQEKYLKGWMMAIRHIGAGTGKRAARYRPVARELLQMCRSAIPAWIMPLYRVVESVTPQEEAFDVAIIDEASQSGMDALFLHYIAKKVVVVGDDKQIAPEYVGLNRDDVEACRRRFIEDVPLTHHYDLENSFFDQAFLRFGNRIRLTEHFRCMPEIIQFSNNLCYQNEPLVPLRQYGEERLLPVVTSYVAEGYTKGQGTNVVNPSEAAAIVTQVETCCHDPRYAGKTMGVISLLGEHQARLIESGLLERIGPEEMERRRIVCGDAYAFQGDERHVVFLSLVVAPDRHFATLTGGRYERRFNVAASRAQDQMWLFHSVTTDRLASRCLRRQLLDYCLNPHVEQDEIEGVDVAELERLANTSDRRQTPPRPFDSWFELDVFLMIRKRGYRVIPQYEVAHYRIDLVVAGMRERVAVECDGEEWHGAEQYERDMIRQRQLERCGWRFWRVRGGTFYRSREASLEPLWEFLERQGIRPIGSEVSPQIASILLTSREEVAGSPEEQQAIIEEPELTPRRGVEQPRDTSEAFGDRRDGPFESEDSSAALEESPEPDSDDRSRTHYTTYQRSLFPEDYELPNAPDPRQGDIHEIRRSLVQIVRRFGPMPCHYTYELYRQACGAGRLSRPMRSILNRAMHAAVRKGDIVEENEYGSQDQINRIVREAGTPKVRVRPRGDRRLDQIAPSEIAAAMEDLTRRETAVGRLNEAYLFKKVLDHYELVRLTERAKDILKIAYEIYKKSLAESDSQSKPCVPRTHTPK